MKAVLSSACLVLATLLAPALARADGDSDRSHPMNYMKDSAITVKVKAKLAEDKMRSLAHISVDTDARGAVTLSGNAHTQKDIDQAIMIARDTEGVTSVTSLVTVRKDD